MSFLPITRLAASSEASWLKVTAILLPSAGWVLTGGEAIAQNSVILNPETAQVTVDRNAIDFRTGPLDNSSNIPLPAGLPTFTSPGFAQPVDRDRLAPSTVEITPDVEYIEQSVNQQLEQIDAAADYTFEDSSLELTTEFQFEQRAGTHGYAEGIEATVLGPAGSASSEPEAAFIRGEGIKTTPDGQPLPATNQLSTTYGADNTVRLRFLNIRPDHDSPSESGVYFTESGELIVEDLQNGGDLDFDDGKFLTKIDGNGELEGVRSTTTTTERTEVEETQLAPERREEEVILSEEPDVVGSVSEAPVPDNDEAQNDTIVEETTDRGEINITQPAVTQLGHARGARTAEGEYLVYDQYNPASGQIRAGTEGITLAGQLSPIVSNPNVAPTFVTGSLTFDPSADNNEAGLVGSARLTQFLTRTHRTATDMFGTPIEHPTDQGSVLLEPSGWGSNRRLVGYVPAAPTSSNRGNAITSVDGIFRLPADQAIEIEPSNPQVVGRGNSAYRNNVGGLLIEKADSSLMFVPQWTENGYEQNAITLAAGEANRIIYALVPQQPGQNLQVGERYEVERSNTGYRISNGGFTVIAANQQPQNFNQEQVEVYAVEDTLPGINTVTNEFNGIQGFYAEIPGGERQPTVDVQRAAEADARVGNQLFTLSDAAAGGQNAYARTTRAGGFYLGGALSLGIGNQQDTVTRTETEVNRAVRGVRTTTALRIFETPLIQRDIRRIETRETIQDMGVTFFDINNEGEVENVRFVPGDIISSDRVSNDIDQSSEIIRGQETLIDTIVQETFEPNTTVEADAVESDEGTTIETDTYPNVSPLQGELSAGAVYNFGNTPWSAAANLVRAELFTQGSAFGQQGNIQAGWRSEVIFHPFGEVQREAYQYDENGNAVPVYQTEPVLAADGSQLKESITTSDGSIMEVAVNQFVTNEEGARFTQKVGTGRSRGPGIYLRLQDVFGDDDSLNVAAGLQLTF